MEMLLQDSPHVGVRCINSQGNSCPRDRVIEYQNRGEKELGGGESGV